MSAPVLPLVGFLAAAWAPPALTATPATTSSSAAATAPTIIDRPIEFAEQRKQLTIEYRRIHQDPSIDNITIDPRVIILHYTAGSSGDGTYRYFNRTKMESARKKLQTAGAVNVSSHFLVERDGTIYRLMPETWMARHCIGMNHVAIGVENVGDGDKYPLTAAQVVANIELVKYLAEKHKGITHLIGHHEYRQMEHTELFLELDPKYRNRKSDPGEPFMSEVRAGVAALGLQGPPRP